MMINNTQKLKFVCMQKPVYIGDPDVDIIIRLMRWPFVGAVYRHRFQMVLDMIKLPIESVLEIGYGSAFLAYILAPFVEQYTGIDIHDKSVHIQERFKEMNLNNATFKNCDARDLSILPEASFDLVVSVSCLEHIKDHRQVQAQVARILKPTGCVLHAVPVKNITTKVFFKIMGYNDNILHPTTHKDVVKSALDVGLVLDKENFFCNERILPLYWVGCFRKTKV